MDPNSDDNFDLLKKMELLSERLNQVVNNHGRSAFAKYPLTFALLALFGAVLLTEGAKEVLTNIGILGGNPWYSILLGLVILVLTGTLYKKLDK